MPRGQWLTPDAAPLLISPHIIYLPVGYEYRIIFRGLLLLLAESGNWEKWGTLTPDDMAQLWTTIFELFTFEEIP